jgi:ubiquinone/menaquinone biosynthesis C-methylase UbiE
MDDAVMKSEIAGTWDEEAQLYDTHVSHGIQTKTEKDLWKKALLSALPEGRTLQILDVGCGTGAMGLILAEMGHTVAGIDLSGGMMAVGRKKAETANLPMTFQSGDAEHPPFPENTFDAIINRHLLWTLPHPAVALQSWHQVLKPEGVVIVIDGVWNDGKLGTKIRRGISTGITQIAERHPHGKKTYSDEVADALPNHDGVPKETAMKYLRDAGFTDVAAASLRHIRDNQRLRMKWYQKLSPDDGYYLISGRKSCITT